MSEYQVDQEREHAYDGITEYDNKLPNWWLLTLYGAIVFSVIYWLVFHTLEIRQLPIDDYHAEMQAAAEAQLARMAEGGLTNESLELMATITERVQAGDAMFQKYCVACHLERGQGSVGPNLTDPYWIHGGEPLAIHKIVMEGVPSKGMAAWGRQLGPRRVDEVVAYVLTLRNTNVPGKAQEGTLFEGLPALEETGTQPMPDSDSESPAEDL